MNNFDADLTRIVDRIYDIAIEEAAQIVDRMRANVALGVDSTISEALVAALDQAAATIRQRLSAPPQASGGRDSDNG